MVWIAILSKVTDTEGPPLGLLSCATSLRSLRSTFTHSRSAFDKRRLHTGSSTSSFSHSRFSGLSWPEKDAS